MYHEPGTNLILGLTVANIEYWSRNLAANMELCLSYITVRDIDKSSGNESGDGC